MYLATEGPAEPDTTLTPCPDIALSLHMPKSFFKTLQAELMEKGSCPSSPKDHVCIYDVLLGQGRFHSLPRAFPFPISHWALNHGRLWELLGPDRKLQLLQE